MKRFSFSNTFVLLVATFCICLMLGGFMQNQVKTMPEDVIAAIPYQVSIDTFVIGTDASPVSRAIGISGALRVSLIVPIIDLSTIELFVSSDDDSTFRMLKYVGVDSDSSVAWHFHSGTGNFGIDLTYLLTGFTHFKLAMLDTPSVARTFTYIMKR